MSTGAPIVQWDDNGSPEEQWRLIPATVSTYDFVAPAAPTSVMATANAASVKLNWNNNTEPDLASYTVLRATNSGGPYDIVARGLTNNTFTDPSANQPENYYYVVNVIIIFRLIRRRVGERIVGQPARHNIIRPARIGSAQDRIAREAGFGVVVPIQFHRSRVGGGHDAGRCGGRDKVIGRDCRGNQSPLFLGSAIVVQLHNRRASAGGPARDTNDFITPAAANFEITVAGVLKIPLLDQIRSAVPLLDRISIRIGKRIQVHGDPIVGRFDGEITAISAKSAGQ